MNDNDNDFAWEVGHLSMVIALALRELREGNPCRAQRLLRGELERFVAESGSSFALADLLTRTAGGRPVNFAPWLTIVDGGSESRAGDGEALKPGERILRGRRLYSSAWLS